MKFLVLGCNGMAGHMISLYLSEQGYDVLGFARSKSAFVESITGDAKDALLIKNLIKVNEFDVIVNCIGLLNQYCEESKADAIYINSYFPHQLSELTKGTKTQVIHLSTDCVFSGERGQYTEDDFRDGATFYDRTKALGELNDDKNMTIRSSIVGPDIKKEGIGLLNWFMQQNDKVDGYSRAIWTGQTTLQLAKTIEMAALVKAHGLYNMVPEISISKYELLRLFNKYLRKDKVDIIPVERIVVDKSLKRTNWDFDYKIPDYECMVSELGKWMYKHKHIYSHYYIQCH